MSENRQAMKDVNVVLVPEELTARANKNLKRRRACKVVCALVIVAVVLTVFFSVILQPVSLGAGKGSVDGKYGYVLADIEGITEANPRIVDIAMLGAHDANTNSLQPDNPIDGYAASTVLGKIQPLVKGFQYRFAVTQPVSVGKQLLQGARFLHLKYADFNGEWLASHTVVGGKVENDVLEILQYLDTHVGEVLILLFHPTYFGEGAGYENFHDWLATVEYNGKNIYDYVFYDKVDVFGDADGENDGVRISSLRYNDVTLNGTSSGVVLLDRREVKVTPDPNLPQSQYSQYFYDMDCNALHEWHNRMGSDVLMEEINATCEEVAAEDAAGNMLHVNQTQASVSAASLGDIFRDIGAWSLLKFAEKHNAALLDNPNFDKWLSVMPIFQVDFLNSDYKDFNRRVNERIRSYNENLVASLIANDGE